MTGVHVCVQRMVRLLYRLKQLAPCLAVIYFAAKVHPAHVLHQEVHGVSLRTGDVHHQGRVPLQQALEHLLTKVPTSIEPQVQNRQRLAHTSAVRSSESLAK